MTEEELEELIGDCPTLYHMAECGAWALIKARGLLSTSALLDVYKVAHFDRNRIERQHRPASIEIRCGELPMAIIRDQIPI